MANFFTDEDILSAFYASDPKLWLREHQPALTRRACYFYEALISESSDMIVRHEVLITHKNPFSPTAHSVIAFSSSAVTSGPYFSLFTTHCEVEISPPECPVERGAWSGLEQDLIKKAHEISQAAGNFVPGPRSIS